MAKRGSGLQEITEPNLSFALLEYTPGSFMVVNAVRNTNGQIVDFRYLYANGSALKNSRKTSLTGKSMLTEFPGLKPTGVFDHYVEVVNSGESWSGEIFFPEYSAWAQVSAQKYEDGCIIAYNNISDKKESERIRVERATDKYKILFNSIDEGFAIVEVVFDKTGNPVDYRFLEVNAVFEKQTQLFDPVGKTIRQLAPNIEEHWIRIYGEVARTREPRRFEEKTGVVNRWYDVFAFPVGLPGENQVAILFNDITERKGISRELESNEALRTAELKESQDFIRRVIHSSPNAVIITHLGNPNKVEQLNDQLMNWLGYTRAEYERLGFSQNALTHPAEQEKIDRFLESMKNVGDSEVKSLEFRLRGKENRWHTMLSFSRVLTRNKSGEPTELLSNIIDITAERETEAKFAEQAHFIEKVISTNPDMVSVVELPSRKIIYFSHQPLSVAGFTNEEIIAMSNEERVQDLVHPEDFERLDEYYDKLSKIEGDNTVEAEYRLRKKDGGISWYRVLGKSFRRDASGRVTQVINIGHDITAQKKAEWELREQAQFINSITNIIPDVVTVVDVTTKRVIYINSDPTKISGYSSEELSAMSPEELLAALVYPEDRKVLADYYKDLESVHADGVAETECRFRRKDGSTFWARVRGRVLRRDRNGRPLQLINIGQNITAEKESRSRINNALEQFRTLVNNTHDFITRWNKDLTMTFANRAYEEFSKAAGTKLDPGALNAGFLSPSWVKKIRTVFKTGKASDHYRTAQAGGEELHFHAHLVPEFTDGVVTSVLVIERDITVIKRAEKELTDLKLTQQKEILNAIIVAQEQERERIGEALHNGVAQLLYGLQSRLQVLKAATEKDEAHREAALSVVELAISDTRKVSFELVPTVLRDYGIVVALQTLSTRIVGDQLKFNIVSKGRERRIHEKTEYAIYRIAQELINNVIKHSGAKEVLIEIGWGVKWLTMTVADNGHGFDSSDIPEKGIGLQSIRNRVRLLDGVMKLTSGQKGTKVEIRVPVQDLPK